MPGFYEMVAGISIFVLNEPQFQTTYYKIQEAMENFVFPDEIKTNLMKINKLMNIFYEKEPSILRERA